MANGERSVTLLPPAPASSEGSHSNIDPAVLATSFVSTPIPTPQLPLTLAPRAPIRNRRRGAARQDKLEGSTRSGEMREPVATVLEGIQRLTDSRRPILHLALEILETEYEGRLTEEHMDLAYDFLESEPRATFFTGMRAGEGRDRWLERKANVKIINHNDVWDTDV